MDEKDLEKFMGDSLRETQEFDFREEDWAEVEGRLGRRSWGIPMWFWYGMGVILLLGTLSFGMYYFQKYQSAKQQLDLMSLEISHLKDTAKPVKTVQKEVRIDTIVKTVYINQYLSTESSMGNLIPAEIRVEPANQSTVIPDNDIVAESQLQLDSFVNVEPKEIPETSAEKGSGEIYPLALLKFDLLQYNRDVKLPPVKFGAGAEKKETKDQSFKSPLYLGIRGGWSLPDNHSDLRRIDGRDSITGHSIDVLAKQAWKTGLFVEFSPKKAISLEAGVQFENTLYTISSLDSVWEDTYGRPLYLGINVFEASVNQRLIRYQIGLKYKPIFKSGLQPYIGGRLSASSVLDQRIGFGFAEVDGTFERTSITNGNIRAFGLEFFAPMLGIELPLNTRWKMQLDGTYYLPLQDLGSQVRSIYGLNLGILYQIK